MDRICRSFGPFFLNNCINVSSILIQALIGLNKFHFSQKIVVFSICLGMNLLRLSINFPHLNDNSLLVRFLIKGQYILFKRAVCRIYYKLYLCNFLPLRAVNPRRLSKEKSLHLGIILKVGSIR